MHTKNTRAHSICLQRLEILCCEIVVCEGTDVLIEFPVIHYQTYLVVLLYNYHQQNLACVTPIASQGRV